MIQAVRFAMALVCAVWCTGCAADYAAYIEEASFSLDSGDYTTAINQANAALTEVPNDFRATMLLAAAYAGQGGINTFSLAETLSDAGFEDEAFKQIHSALVGVLTSTGLTDLRSAIEILRGFSGTFPSTNDRSDYRFQMGLLQTIESFGLPTITAKPTSAATITATDITATHRSNVQTDFLEADNNLILGGLEADNQLVDTVRTNYCVLKSRSGTSGFTLAEIQDLTLCQLSANPSGETTFQSGSVTACSDFNFSACTAVDTEL